MVASVKKRMFLGMECNNPPIFPCDLNIIKQLARAFCGLLNT